MIDTNLSQAVSEHDQVREKLTDSNTISGVPARDVKQFLTSRDWMITNPGL